MTLHFIRPYCLWLFIPVFIYLLLTIYLKRQFNPWKKVCDPHLLPALVQGNQLKTHRLFHLLLFLFYTICIIALAGPSWNKISLPIYREMNSLMLVLDLSAAMDETDLAPSRLTRAKYKIRDLINAAHNTQMGLVVFTQEAFSVSPLSQDASTLDSLLDELQTDMMPLLGSDTSQGLTEGHRLLRQAGVQHGNLLLMTASNPIANSFNVAKSIAKEGGHLNVLAMVKGDPNNQTLLENLKRLSAVGGGSFFLFTPDATDIQSIINTAGQREVIVTKTESATLWQDGGPWLCLLLIPFALLLLREKIHYGAT